MPKKRPHYIPQFYLEKFTDITDDDTPTPYVWVFERGKKTPYRRAPRNIARKKGFYDVKDFNGEIISVVEDFLSDLEGKSSKVLNKVLNKQLITSDERKIFALFVVVMRNRVPHFRNFVNEVIKDLTKKFLELSAAQPGYLEKWVLEKEQKTGTKVDINVNELRKSILSDDFPYEISVNPGFLIRVMLDTLFDVELRQILSEMSWSFLFAPQNCYFVTSDNPVVVIDPENRKEGAGYKNSSTVQLTFPLSSNMCFMATWSKNRHNYQNINPSLLREINLRTCKYSTKYVFSPKEKIQLPKT